MTIKEFKEWGRQYRRDIIFGCIGVTLFVFLVVVFFGAIGFLTASLDDALDVDASQTEPTRFNIDGLKTLGIIEDSS